MQRKTKIRKAAAGECLITGNLVRETTKFLSEIMEARRQWNNVLKMLKQKDHQSIILCPAKLSFKNEEKIKTLPD